MAPGSASLQLTPPSLQPSVNVGPLVPDGDVPGTSPWRRIVSMCTTTKRLFAGALALAATACASESTTPATDAGGTAASGGGTSSGSSGEAGAGGSGTSSGS